jgi:protein-S-isoprenylcysteine O-methyltransferase Ste14
MSNQAKTSKGPGVYFPPPLVYISIFIIAVLFQKKLPISNTVFQMQATKIAGTLFLLIALYFIISGVRQFFRSKNTLILIKPATSLQKTGIYGISRNPMYCGLAIAYLGITCFIGSWWNIILFPILILICQEFIIKREEKYLELEFGPQYNEYRKKVRRWL